MKMRRINAAQERDGARASGGKGKKTAEEGAKVSDSKHTTSKTEWVEYLGKIRTPSRR